MPDDDDNGDRKRETRKESLMGRFSGSSKTTETSSTTESSEAKNSPVASKTAETSRASSTTEVSETETPTRERKNVNMYLPEPLIDDLGLAFDKLNLELRQAGESKLEKNRHYRALVLTLGLDALEDLDVEDVKDVLDGDDRLDDAP